MLLLEQDGAASGAGAGERRAAAATEPGVVPVLLPAAATLHGPLLRPRTGERQPGLVTSVGVHYPGRRTGGPPASVGGGTACGLLEPGERDQRILGPGRELAEDARFPERVPRPPLGVLLPHPTTRHEVGAGAVGERGVRQAEQVIEAQAGQVRAVERRYGERAPAVAVAREGVVEGPARDRRVAEREHAHVAAGADALDGFPDVCLHPGRLVDDDQEPPMEALEPHALVRREPERVVPGADS